MIREQSLAEYEASVITEYEASQPLDPALERFERRTFRSRQRGRYNGWRRRADGSWEHRIRRNRQVANNRIVDLIHDKTFGTTESVRTFQWDVFATEIYPGDPDALEKFIEVMGGEQEIEFQYGIKLDQFGDRRTSAHRR